MNGGHGPANSQPSSSMMNSTAADVELHQTIPARTHWGNWAPTSPTYRHLIFLSCRIRLAVPELAGVCSLSVPDLNGRQRGYTRGER